MKPITDYWKDTTTYIQEAIVIADNIYEDVAYQIKQNGSYSITWIQYTFNVCYHTAAHIADKLEAR